MPLEFYFDPTSPASRAAWMTLEELGLEYNKNVLDLMAGEHKTKEYAKINPMQKVPGLKDDDFCIGESRAIAAYLVNKFGDQQGKQSLYPSDPQKRGAVDQQLYISENIVKKIKSYLNIPNAFLKGEDIKEDNIEMAKEAVQFIEDLLTKCNYTAGNEFTISDIFYYMAAGLLDMVDFDWSNYTKVMRWRAEIAARAWHAEVWAEPQAKFKELFHKKRGRGNQNS